MGRGLRCRIGMFPAFSSNRNGALGSGYSLMNSTAENAKGQSGGKDCWFQVQRHWFMVRMMKGCHAGPPLHDGCGWILGTAGRAPT